MLNIGDIVVFGNPNVVLVILLLVLGITIMSG